MLKSQEIGNPNSCLNKANRDEMLFVLIGRDAAAPRAIRAWIKERIRLGKNQPENPQLIEAEEWAVYMERHAS